MAVYKHPSTLPGPSPSTVIIATHGDHESPAEVRPAYRGNADA